MAEQPLVVYQMGKVGSRSVYEALKDIDSKYALFHTHTIKYDHVYRYLRYLYKIIHIDRTRTKFISLTRDPFKRNISSFFETLGRHLKDEKRVRNMPLKRLIHLFFERYDHTEPLIWFDREVRRVTGIDVYRHKLQDEGYLTVESEKFDLMVLKCEVKDSLKEELIEEFLGIKGVDINRKNITSKKPFGNVYNKFKNNVVFDEEYIDEFVSSKYFRHFYSDEKERILRDLNRE